jgi:predicted phosphoadenosine phosphosulfate sulfurtransferase
MGKRALGLDVLTAARQRMRWVFETFPRIYISFSGGKDSTVLLDIAATEARACDRRFGCLFIDLEAQYQLTIDHVERCFSLYADVIDPHWVALPIALRNAVSQYDPRWLCWDPDARDRWVRQPSAMSITDGRRYPFFRSGMEFEEFTPDFGHWYAQGQLTACLVGIRADESLNRYRTLIMDKQRFEGKGWTTWTGRGLWNAYPLYDWRTDDIWVYHAKTGAPHNAIYDRMHRAGLSVHQMRICQPYGDDQRKGLWLYHILEPENWPRVVARVNGANFGALYAHETGTMLGRLRIEKPPGHTWQSYAKFLLESMPPKTREHYENKVAVFLKWWMDRGYPHGIPDEVDAKQEAARELPSWRRIVKVLVKGDWWCKGLSFGMNKSTAYENYLKVMKKRRQKWGI